MRAELVNDADDERAVAAFRALCPEAAEHGVSLCFEGSLPAERIASIAARVGSDAFGCYFDLANPLAHKGLDSRPRFARSAGSSSACTSRTRALGPTVGLAPGAWTSPSVLSLSPRSDTTAGSPSRRRLRRRRSSRVT